MSLKDVLKEQIERNHKNIMAYERKIASMPKGTLHVKKRGDKEYYYLKYRNDEGKRIDEYVKSTDVKEIRSDINRRKEYQKFIKDLKQDIAIAKKGLR